MELNVPSTIDSAIGGTLIMISAYWKGVVLNDDF